VTPSLPSPHTTRVGHRGGNDLFAFLQLLPFQQASGLEDPLNRVGNYANRAGNSLNRVVNSPNRMLFLSNVFRVTYRSLSQLSLLYGTAIRGLSAGSRVFEVSSLNVCTVVVLCDHVNCPAVTALALTSSD